MTLGRIGQILRRGRLQMVGLMLASLPGPTLGAEPVAPLVVHGHRLEDTRIKPPPRTAWIDVAAAGLPLPRAKLEVIDGQTGESSTIQADNFGKAKPVLKAGVPHTILLAHEGYLVQSITNVLAGGAYRFDTHKQRTGDGWKRLARNGPTECQVPGLGAVRVAGVWKSQAGEGVNLFVANDVTVEGRLGLHTDVPGEYHLLANETYRGGRGRARTRFVITSLVPGRPAYLVYQADPP